MKNTNDLPVSIADAVYRRDVAEGRIVDGRIVESSEYGGPRLMVIHPKQLTPEGRERLKASLDEAMKSGQSKPVVFEDGIKVLQFVDGRWQALN